MACGDEFDLNRARGRDDIRALVPLVTVLLCALAVSLGMLARCATSPQWVGSDREQNTSACVGASIGFNDRNYLLLPFDIDRDAYRHCVEEHG